MNNFKKGLLELLKTLSSRASFFSSRRIERFVFTGVTVGAVITCIIYEVAKDKLTATEVIILTTPLLIAAGYNLSTIEKSKKENPKPDEGQD